MIKVKRFTAVWCGPCRQLAPIFEQFKESFPEVEFQTIDVDTSPEETQENFITSVPATILIMLINRIMKKILSKKNRVRK